MEVDDDETARDDALCREAEAMDLLPNPRWTME
jgi:hypothetical protein